MGETIGQVMRRRFGAAATGKRPPAGPGVAVILLLASLSAACERRPPKAEAALQDGHAQLEPERPAGYRTVAPAAAVTSREILSQTAAVFSGVVRDIRLTYGDCAGPRTEYVFDNVSVLRGTAVPPATTLKLLGGPTPRGTWVSVSELPRLALGARYVVFLRNTDWTYSPVVGDLALRQEEIGGRQLLINSAGQVLTGWSSGGPAFSAGTVSGTVGQDRRAYRSGGPPGPPGPAPEPSAEAREAEPTAEAADEAEAGEPIRAVQRGSPSRPRPTAPADRTLADAPSAEDLVRSGMFSRPALAPADSVAAVSGLSTESLVRSLHAAERAEGVRIGGAIRIHPLWKCWATTDTVRSQRQRGGSR